MKITNYKTLLQEKNRLKYKMESDKIRMSANLKIMEVQITNSIFQSLLNLLK